MKKIYTAPKASIILFEGCEMLALSRQTGETINSGNSADFEQLSQKKENPIWNGNSDKGIWE